MSPRPIIKLKIKTVRQHFPHGRSKEVVVERRGMATKQPEKSKLANPAPEKPVQKQLPKKNQKPKRAKRKRKKRPQGHLFRPSEPPGPRSVVFTLDIAPVEDRYLQSAGMPGNEEGDP